jgi:uncharacterized protein YlxW (UPF0749 family)
MNSLIPIEISAFYLLIIIAGSLLIGYFFGSYVAEKWKKAAKHAEKAMVDSDFQILKLLKENTDLQNQQRKQESKIITMQNSEKAKES